MNEYTEDFMKEVLSYTIVRTALNQLVIMGLSDEKDDELIAFTAALCDKITDGSVPKLPGMLQVQAYKALLMHEEAVLNVVITQKLLSHYDEDNIIGNEVIINTSRYAHNDHDHISFDIAFKYQGESIALPWFTYHVMIPVAKDKVSKIIH